MKEPSVVFIALVLIIIISVLGMTCQASKLVCKHLNYICHSHIDCCSQYCYNPLEMLELDSGICKQQPTIDKYITVSKGICEFHIQTDESEVEYLNNEFDDLNAAHESLPPYTQIIVSHNGKKIGLTINDRIPRTNGTLLDLSNEAAKKLNIENEEYVHCKIEKVMYSHILEFFLITVPIVSIIVFIAFNLFC